MKSENQEKISQLKELIKNHKYGREVKRALAVKLVLEGYRYGAIEKILFVSEGFISKWYNGFKFGGIKALRSGHEGSKGYLINSEKAEKIKWLIEQKAWDVSELEVYLIERYDVAYQSRQSYYQILKEARVLWQKVEQINPKNNEELTQKKNQKIANFIESKRGKIEPKKLILYIIYECHIN